MILPRLRLLIIVGLFLGLLGEGIFLLGLLGSYRFFSHASGALAIVLIGSAVLTLMSWGGEIRAGFVALREHPTWERRLFFLCCFLSVSIFAAGALLSLLPPTQRDALIQHLAVPKLYLRHEAVIPLPSIPTSYYPMTIEALFLIPLTLGWDSGAHGIALFFGVLTAGLLYLFLTRLFGPTQGMIACTLFLLTPVVLPLLSSAYVDLPLAFYGTASLMAIFFFLHTRGNLWLVLAALSAGMASATKYQGIVVAGLLLWVLTYSLIRKKLPLPRITAYVLLFAVLALLPFLPWGMRNLLWTGNPIFPLHGIAVAEPQFSPLMVRTQLYGEDWIDLLLLPFRVFFSGEEGNPRRFDGVLGPGLLLFPFAMKIQSRGRDFSLFAVFSLLLVLLSLLLLPVRARYLLPMVPAASVLASLGLYRMLSSPRFRIVGLVGFAGCTVFFLLHTGAWLRALNPIPFLVGKEGREEYLEKRLRDYAAVSFVNRNLPENARVYLLLTGDRGYYLDREYLYDPGQSARHLVRSIRDSKTPEELLEGLQAQKISHIFSDERLLDRYLRDNLTAAEVSLWLKALGKLKPMFRKNGFAVYGVLPEFGEKRLRGSHL